MKLDWTNQSPLARSLRDRIINFTFGLSPPSVGKSKTVWVDVRVSAKIKRTAPAKDKLLIKNFGSDKILYPIHCIRIIPKRI